MHGNHFLSSWIHCFPSFPYVAALLHRVYLLAQQCAITGQENMSNSLVFQTIEDLIEMTGFITGIYINLESSQDKSTFDCLTSLESTYQLVIQINVMNICTYRKLNLISNNKSLNSTFVQLSPVIIFNELRELFLNQKHSSEHFRAFSS